MLIDNYGEVHEVGAIVFVENEYASCEFFLFTNEIEASRAVTYNSHYTVNDDEKLHSLHPDGGPIPRDVNGKLIMTCQGWEKVLVFNADGTGTIKNY